MATLAQIMDELAVVIREAVAAVTDIDVQVDPRGFRAPSTPCIDMYPADPSDDQQYAAFGDLAGGELITVRARVSTADAEAGEDLLLAFMDDEDPLSIWAALEEDPTLNGLANDVNVLNRSGYRDFPDLGGEGSFLGCLWTVVVLRAQS